MYSKNNSPLAQRVLGAVDLAIDFATLGQYGLEPSPDGPCRERPGRKTGWEALATARPRGACPQTGVSPPPRYAESRLDGRLSWKETAATYSPRRSRTKYHRR